MVKKIEIILIIVQQSILISLKKRQVFQLLAPDEDAFLYRN